MEILFQLQKAQYYVVYSGVDWGRISAHSDTGLFPQSTPEGVVPMKIFLSHRLKRVVWLPLTIIALALINIVACLAFFIAVMFSAAWDTYRKLCKRFDAYVAKRLDDVFGGFAP